MFAIEFPKTSTVYDSYFATWPQPEVIEDQTHALCLQPLECRLFLAAPPTGRGNRAPHSLVHSSPPPPVLTAVHAVFGMTLCLPPSHPPSHPPRQLTEGERQAAVAYNRYYRLIANLVLYGDLYRLWDPFADETRSPRPLSIPLRHPHPPSLPIILARVRPTRTQPLGDGSHAGGMTIGYVIVIVIILINSSVMDKEI